MSVTNPDQVSCAQYHQPMLCVHKVNHIRTTQKALSPASTYSSAIFKITCYMQSHSLQIHPIPYHQSPLTMLLRESLSVERRRQTKVTFFRQLLIVVYNWLFYSPLQIFKNKTCTDLAPGKRLSLRRRSSQFHGNTRVSDFHSSPRIFFALALFGPFRSPRISQDSSFLTTILKWFWSWQVPFLSEDGKQRTEECVTRWGESGDFYFGLFWFICCLISHEIIVDEIIS